MRDIVIYEEDDSSCMFGFKDHVNRVTIFEVKKSGLGYTLIIDGQVPEFIYCNGSHDYLKSVEDD